MSMWGQGVNREDLENLQRLLETHSRLRGTDFTLSSGLPTKYYFDAKPVTMSSEGAALIGKIIRAVIADTGAEAIGGLEIGAIPIALAAAWQSRDEVPAVIVREKTKEHGTKDRIPACHLFNQPLAGGRSKKRVAVVDDVVTTGNSIDQAIDALMEDGHEIVAVVALVTRPEAGGVQAMRKKFGSRISGEYISIFECDYEGNLKPAVDQPVGSSAA